MAKRNEFQFQSGTIKGAKDAAKAYKELLFQFQSGTIKGGLDFGPRRAHAQISIPIWYD